MNSRQTSGSHTPRTVIRECKVNLLVSILLIELFMDIVLCQLSGVKGAVTEARVLSSHLLDDVQLQGLGLLLEVSFWN